MPVGVKCTKGSVGMVEATDFEGHWPTTKGFCAETKSFFFELDHTCQDPEVDIILKDVLKFN